MNDEAPVPRDGSEQHPVAPEQDPDAPEPASTWVKLFLLVEAAAAVIGLIMPLTPSKTGSDSDLPDWFLDDPTYLQRAFFDFVFTNLVIVVVGLAFWAHWVWRKRRTNTNRP